MNLDSVCYFQEAAGAGLARSKIAVLRRAECADSARNLANADSLDACAVRT